MTTLPAKGLTLKEVHQLLGFQRHYAASFSPLLSLEPTSEFEQQELLKIRDDFDAYIADSKVLEGMVKALTVLPLLRLTGFYTHPIKLALEESIDRIIIDDEDISITGRFDLLAINKHKPDPFFWVLIAEAKNSDIDPNAGLAQLLTYAYSSLKSQETVWGLATNGDRYQFVHICAGKPPSYWLMPSLNLLEATPSEQLIQVLKAICRL